MFQELKICRTKFFSKYLKSLSDKFLTTLTRLEFINCILPIKTRFLFKKNAMYFYSPIGITSIFTSNLLSLLKIKWRFNLLNCEILLELLFMLQLQWAAPLNLPVTWQWSLTFSSSSLMSILQIQQMLLDWYWSSSSIMIKSLLKSFLITFLQCS